MAYLMPLKLKYKQPGRLLRRQGIDPLDGTWTYVGSRGGTYVSRDVSNGPNRVKKYTKRANKVVCRKRVYSGGYVPESKGNLKKVRERAK